MARAIFVLCALAILVATAIGEIALAGCIGGAGLVSLALLVGERRRSLAIALIGLVLIGGGLIATRERSESPAPALEAAPTPAPARQSF